MPRCAVVFGQYGDAADPVNLPHFRDRLAEAGWETILIEHFDSKSAYTFLNGYHGFKSLVGSSLGAMSVVVFAGYLSPNIIDFIGGFQPSDWDPSGHIVSIPLYDSHGQLYDTVTHAITVPANVRRGIVFRNPVAALTGGLGHAAWIAANSKRTNLQTLERADVHPGDFGEAQDTMFNDILEAAK